jgi:hypothetical protein
LELKPLRKMYIFKKSAESLCNLRFNLFFKNKSLSHLTKCEALLCLIFPVKTTLVLDDFIEIFKLIYRNPLSILFINNNSNNSKDGNNNSSGNAAAASFINCLNSPNLILVKKNEIYNLTVSPLRSEDFREWRDSSEHKKVFEIETRILQQGNGVGSGDNAALKSSLSLQDSSVDLMENLIKIAGLNIPRGVQNKIDKKLEFGHMWEYLKANLNFEGNEVEGVSVRTFFD